MNSPIAIIPANAKSPPGIPKKAGWRIPVDGGSLSLVKRKLFPAEYVSRTLYIVTPPATPVAEDVPATPRASNIPKGPFDSY
jgi:hypothetical protein